MNRKFAWVTASAIALSTMAYALPVVASTNPAQSGVVQHAPRMKSGKVQGTSNSGWSSTNWSGYAITGGPYNSITGTWVVPAVQPSKRATYSSSWIGIDGFSNSSLIQTGTEQDFYNGSAHYGAWWEILPASETPISSMTVKPGDTMYADIENLGGGTWSITLKDVTRNESFTTDQQYTGPQTSAEWIQEAPTVGGRVATLANYGQATFDPGTVNGHNPGLTAADGGVMVKNGTQISTPSNPDSDADGFNVAYGASSPAAPTS